jgi:maltose alpha-D-glucosyltransferase/alpha-amylase
VDVAGMIRSFHYCSRVGQSNVVKRGLVNPDDAPTLGTAAQLWYVAVSGSFLRAYLDLAGKSEFLPTKPDDLERLLQVYLLEKACYELRYELNNRPDWAEVPLAGILEVGA